jgi:uncharacterized protein (DUF342 family)
VNLTLKKNGDVMKYDEVRITTCREIKVCEGAIKKLTKAIAALEKKYNKTSREFLQDFDPYADQSNGELINWHDNCCALQRWKERLAAHRQIMEM